MTTTFHPASDFRRASGGVRPLGTSGAPRPACRSAHLIDSRRAPARPATARPNYAARRAVAAAVAIIAVAVIAAGVVLAGEVVGGLADLGGRPAAASEVSAAAGASPVATSHVAAPGDTLWSIADRYRGSVSRDRYVDALINLNGGTGVQIGQAIRLP